MMTGMTDMSARRVALVVDRLAPGGKERIVATLAMQFRQMGVETTVICLHSPGELAGEVTAAGVEVVSIDSTTRWDVPAIGRLAEAIRVACPDVVNVHDRSSLPYVRAASRHAGGKPIILSCHGLLIASHRAKLIQAIAAGDLAALTAVAPHVADSYVASLGTTAPVAVIPNGVVFPPVHAELRDQVRRSLDIEPDVFVFLAVGTIKREKGYPDLLAACELLHKQRPDFRLVIAGGTDDEIYWRVIQHAITGGHLERIVKFLGHHADTDGLYAMADAYVLPSRTEGLPLAVLEAASAGLPIIATDVGDVGNVLDGGAGLLVEPGDPDALAEAMNGLMDSAELREDLGRAAAARMRKDFGAETMARSYIELYDHVVAGQKPTTRPGVILVGPQTPTTGGMSAVVRGIWRAMTGRGRQTIVINSGKTTPTGRSAVAGVFAQMRLAWRLARAIRRTGAKIVHIHTCSGRVFWRDVVLAAIARLGNRRVVWHIHGGRFGEFAASCGRMWGRVMRWALETASAVVALSDGWRAALQPIAPKATWRVVPNGVPIEATDETASERFLFLGNLGPSKGAADLIAAVAIAKQRGGELHVDLAGPETAPGQRESLAKAIDEAGLGHHVRLVGVVSGSAKQRALAAAGCLVQPSAVEAMPLSVLEALAAGRAVIATDVGAIGEMIDDGVEGVVIQPGDVTALADAMMRLAGDSEERHRMGAAAREKARRCYSEQAMADALEGVYDLVIN